MAHATDLLERARAALGTLRGGDLGEGARALLGVLGYRSPKSLDAPADPARFFDLVGVDAAKMPHGEDWREVRFLFQLTGDELPALSREREPATPGAFQRGAIDSFVFLALDGTGRDWTRRELTVTARAINRAFAMPVILLFRIGGSATLAVIDRRPHARDASRDVVGGRVSLVKDIDLGAPHRAHLEILADLSLPALAARHPVPDFRGLYDAWLATLSADALNRRFYDELSRWFAWAATAKEKGGADLRFPKGQGDGEGTREVALIRLLTRLMFTWFVKEKGLVPPALFDRGALAELLHDAPHDDPDGHGYYLAVLQNLFFATLNTERDKRDWRRDSSRGSADYLGHHRYRHEAMFRDPATARDAFAPVPFLNGGLFECLDVPIEEGDERAGLAEREGRTPVLRIDGFSDQPAKQPRLPNRLFFGGAAGVDLSEWFGKRSRPVDVPGLIDLFERYKFTVEENTPLEEEAALDPELLGKVFENLLASYNADTRTTARAKSGSFYTPREVVDFMVDEALVAWLLPKLQPELDLAGQGAGQGGLRPRAPGLDFGPGAGELALAGGEEAGPRIKSGVTEGGEGDSSSRHPGPDPEYRLSSDEARLRAALDYAATSHGFSDAQADAIVAAIEGCRAIDPAVGSGAFPLGLLQKLVHVLGLLDPGGAKWRERNRAYYVRRVAEASDVLAPTEGDKALDDARDALSKFDRAFESGHYPDYTRKLFLIERVLHGVDVQPIAVQIAKLRCFISLAVEQRVDDDHPDGNRGVTPLPNLETKFVAANTLTPLHRREAGLISRDLIGAQERLRGTYRAFFAAANGAAKRAARERIRTLRGEIAGLVRREDVFPPDEADKLARWDLFDPNASAPFFDAELMFGLEAGADQGLFDLVLANPPYVRQEKIEGFTVAGRPVLRKAELKRDYRTYTGTADLFVYFYERAVTLLKPGGALSFITSNKWFRAGYGAPLRRWLPERARILKLVDFGDAPVFEAIAYPTILVATRRGAADPPKAGEAMRVLNWTRGWDRTGFAGRVATDGFDMPQNALATGGWQFEPQAERDLLARLRARGTPLGEWCAGRFYRGILTGLNDAFVLDELEHPELIGDPRHADLLKPFLRGRDVKRWRVEPAGRWLVKIASSENETHPWSALPAAQAEAVFARTYPAIYEWFTRDDRREKLIKRADQGRFWWELRSCAYWGAFEEPKIIVPAIVARGEAARDLDRFYCNNKATIFVAPSPEVAAAVVNSSTADWFARQTFASKEGGFLDFEPRYSGTIPVPPADAPQQELLAAASTAASVAGASRPRFEALVNGMVYELFFPEEAVGVFAAADAAGLPALAAHTGPALASAADEWSRHLADPAHPLYARLLELQSLDPVRIIEGR